MQVEDLNVPDLYRRLLDIVNANTRRKHVIALRSIFREQPWAKELKVFKGRARVYNLPDESTLRLALMMSPYELQGLMMMYGGLRVSESCAIGPGDVEGKVLKVYYQIHEKGYYRTEAKTTGDVLIPQWLAERVRSIDNQLLTLHPPAVRQSLLRAGNKVGIHLNPNMLRHWYCTQFVLKQINPKIAQQQMRHSDLTTTLTFYAQVTGVDIEGVIDDLFG
jgi:integrase